MNYQLKAGVSPPFSIEVSVAKQTQKITKDMDWAARRAKTQRHLQRNLIKRMLQGSTDMADSHMENDARVYTDPVRFKRETELIFQNQPIVACISADIPEIGSSLVFEDAGPSILITRNKQGRAQAFLNMCTHRGAKLKEGCQKSNSITCPFHAWTFDLDGKLVGVPGSEAFVDVDRQSRGLVKVPCQEWGGMVFVIAKAGDDTIDIEAFMGEFAPELLQLEMHKAEPVKSGIIDANTNWKYALDTYGEGYHFASLHKNTVALFSMSNISFYEPFGRHHRINFPPHVYKEFMNKPEHEWPEMDFGSVHYLFPNTVIFFGSLSPGVSFLQLFRLFPGDEVGKLRTRFDVYAPFGVSSEAHRADVETLGYDATLAAVANEDYWVAAGAFARLLESPAGFKVIYGANEPALQAHHKTFADVIGMPLDIYN